MAKKNSLRVFLLSILCAFKQVYTYATLVTIIIKLQRKKTVNKWFRDLKPDLKLVQFDKWL